MDLQTSLCSLAKATNAKFTFCGKPINNEEIFSQTGLLPSIAQRADRISLLCLGYGIGASFVEAEKSLLGIKVQFDDVTPDVLRLIFIYDVLLGIVKASISSDQVSLDELMYD